MAARHFKYAYNAHIPPKIIFSKMILVNEPLKNDIDLTSEKNKIYFSRRKQLKNLMRPINSFIDFNSQTYFLMLYYMDIIFTHKDLEKIFYSHFTLWYQYPMSNDLQMNNYVLLSLACLVVASKFNENDPSVPSMSSYIRLLYEFSKKKYFFNLDSLFLAEIVILKILKYKLNYYTIYHYLIFFFTHGIVLKKTIERSKIYKKISERKIMEKVYIKVREIFDEIIESEKYYKYYCGKDNYEIVVEILLWCTEHILDEEIKDDENIFKLIYGINIAPSKKKEMYNIIAQIYDKIKKRNALSKSTRLIELSNSKNINNNLLNPKTNLLSSRIQNNNSNYNNPKNYVHNIKQKSSIINSTLFIDQTSYDQNFLPSQKSTNNDYFKYINSNIQNESLKNNHINNNKNFNNNNYLSQIPYNYNNNNQNRQLNKTTNIKYGPNKRIYLTTNKNKVTNSAFNVNSIEKMDLKNNSEGVLIRNINADISKRYNSSKKDKIPPFQIEKEPIDNKKQLNDNTGKIILINDNNNNESKLRKKSLSCSKNISENDYELYYPKSNDGYNNINNKNRKTLINENIKGTKIDSPSHSNELNDYYFAYKVNGQNKEKKDLIEKPLIKKEITVRSNKSQISEYKKYLLTKNLLQKNSLNGSYINNINTDQKIIRDNIVNRKKYFESINNNINNKLKKFNVTLELEPQDNYRRRSANKYYIDTGKKNINQNNNYKNSKANTIIINNNIQINTLIDDKSRNLYLIHNDGINDDLKYNYENKYRNNKTNMKTEYKDIRKTFL